MTTGTEQRKLAAIMFTDMVDYNALSQRNEALALELLEEHRRVVRGLLSKHGGREVKTTGDGFLLEFPSALAAVLGALEIQNALHERNQVSPTERQLRIRIGIHVGDVVMKDGDIHGDGVNIAARMEPLAAAGGICISNAVHEQVRNKVSQPMAALGPAELKNIELAILVHRVVMPWEGAVPAAVKLRKPSPMKPGGRALAVGLTAVLVLFAAIAWWPKATGRIRSLAVKPLDDFSGDTNNAYLSDGMIEALCAALGNVSALRVPGRSSVMRYKGGHKSISEMAKELDVEAVVEGSIQRAGTRAMITVQLIEAATDRHLWATNYQRELSDFFTVQNEVAQAIAREINIRLSPQDQTRLANAPSSKPEIIEAYLRGRWQLDRRTVAGFTNAIALFVKVIELDSNYAPGYAGLASAYAVQPFLIAVPGTNAAVRAKLFAEKTLRFDPNSAEALSALGFVQMWADRDWAAAEVSFKKAINSNPHFSQAYYFYANLLARRGRFSEALGVNQRAITLEPNVEVFQMLHGLIYCWSGDRKRGIEFTEAAARSFPDYRLLTRSLAMEFIAHGDFERAITLLNVPGHEADDLWQAFLGVAYAHAGRREEGERILQRLQGDAASRYVVPITLMMLHASLGEMDRAFEITSRLSPVRRCNLSSLICGPIRGSMHF
ncbi:MAG: adenylate/guanylate cyclase domain-containing protein [Pedosphaera sp.]|nr:adenylate/guanylate cyclase domain-containing protein [Pedosphaera sp.]